MILPKDDDSISNLSSRIGYFPLASEDILPALKPSHCRPLKATFTDWIVRPSSDTSRVILAPPAVAMAINPTRVAPGLDMDGGTVSVGGMGVSVGGTAVAVGGTGVSVGGTSVAVGGSGVVVGGTGAAIGAPHPDTSRNTNEIPIMRCNNFG